MKRIVVLGRSPWRNAAITGGDRYMLEFAAAAAGIAPVHVASAPSLPERWRRLPGSRFCRLACEVLWYLMHLPLWRRDIIVHDLADRASLALVTRVARALPGCRLVTVVQGIYHHDGVSPLRRRLETCLARLDLRGAHTVIVNSEATRATTLALGVHPQRVRVVAPGVEPSMLVRRGKQPPHDELRLLFVGGQCKAIKGLDVLVEAIGLLGSPRLHATFVGECDGPTCGPYVQGLRQRARELGIESQLRFTGYLDAEQLRRCYGEHDVFVLPSRWEGYGIAVLEAMAAGLPALVTRCGGAADLVDHGKSGFHFDPAHPQELAAYLQCFLDDPGLAARLGDPAAQQAREIAWSWTDARAALQDILRRAAGTSRTLSHRLGDLIDGVLRDRGAPRRPARTALQNGERVLVIEREGLGDALVMLPALATLAATFPACRIDVLASPRNAAAFALLPRTGRTEAPRGCFELLRTLLRLRAGRYDWVIAASPLFRFALLALGVGGRRRAGFAVRRRRLGLDLSVPWDTTRHQVDRRLDLVRALGAVRSRSAMRAPRLARRQAMSWMRVLEGVGPLVVLHSRCAQPCNLWIDARWIELGRRLEEETGARVVLTGSAGEGAEVEALAAAIPGAHCLAGKLDVCTLFEILRHADLLVTLDTGVMHLGALAGTPTVVLLGGRNPAHEWAPRHGTVRVVRHPVACSPCRSRSCPLGNRACMHGIEVDAVAAAAHGALRSRGAAQREVG